MLIEPWRGRKYFPMNVSREMDMVPFIATKIFPGGLISIFPTENYLKNKGRLLTAAVKVTYCALYKKIFKPWRWNICKASQESTRLFICIKQRKYFRLSRQFGFRCAEKPTVFTY